MNRLNSAIFGGAFIIMVIAVQHRLLGPAVMGLSLGLVIAYGVWLARFELPLADPKRTYRIYCAAVALQGLHVLEEYFTNFYRQFPAWLGYEWSAAYFLWFNFFWLIVFVVAAQGLKPGSRLALLVVWFMAIVVGVGNGVAHMVVSLARGGYFPGAITACGHLIIGVLLLKSLLARRERAL